MTKHTDYTPYDALPAALLAELEDAGLDTRRLYAQVTDALDEDLADGGDTTSLATIGAEQVSTGEFAAREKGVVSGLGIAALVFHVVSGDAVTVSERIPDGTPVVPGQRVMVVHGRS